MKPCDEAVRPAAASQRGPAFVVVDVETTGWRPGRAALTEIGAVRLSGGRVTAEFSALVNPGMPIPDGITELTGITDAMVSGAPPAGDVLTRFIEFAGDGIIAAHNAPFDIAFLTDACRRSGISWQHRAVIDTVLLARLVLRPDEVPDCKLATLARHFGAETRPCHRALADARATADVLAGLIALLGSRGSAASSPRAVAAAWAARALTGRSRLIRRLGGLAGTLLGAAGSRAPGAARRRQWSRQ